MAKTVYSPLKIFAFPDHSGDCAELRAPIHVRIKPINACNHRCWFCAYRSQGLSLGEEMELRDRIPYEKLIEIVDDLAAMGVKAVTFSGGGEPLLYPNLAGIVERLGERGIRVATLTNGTYLKGAVADALARWGTWVRVSMDGWDGESYQRFRHCKPGEFEEITGNVAAFAARRSSCSVGVSLIVSRENAAHVYGLCALVKALGADHVKLSACIVADGAGANNAYHDEIRREVECQVARARALENDRFRVVDRYHAFEESFEKPYKTCPMLEYLTIIGADCKVYTCQDKAYESAGLLGSIRDRSFADFWASRENAERIAAIDPSILCRHHCVAHDKNVLLTQYRDLAAEHRDFV